MASLSQAARRGPGVDRRRWAAIACSVLVLSLLTLPATADTKSELSSARDRVAALEADIKDQRADLARLQSEADAMATRVSAAEGKLEEIKGELRDMQASLARAKSRLAAVQEQFDARTRDLYMQGPANNFNFILGAASMNDLSDRLEYASVLTQADTDLANQVQNLSDQLTTAVGAQQTLMARQADAVDALNTQMDALNAQFDRQQAIVDAIAAKQAEAERIVSGLQKKYRNELAAMIAPGGGSPGGISGIFQTCPVGQPRAISNGFGAPRYGGGYHLHAGNDIMAPTGTPIYAPFAGVARSSYDSLGGNAVYVTGATGYVYNAHLNGFSSNSNGSVQAGDVVGYVGSTGDTSTPHDHFEWHPNVIPSGWPASPYGYSVIGDAVNPYPALAAVC